MALTKLLSNLKDIFHCVAFFRFSVWLYAKGLASLLLVMPQFSVASYVYMHFVKPHVSPNPHVEKVTEKNDCIPTKISDYIDAAPIYVEQEEKDNLQSLVNYEVIIVFRSKRLLIC